MPSTLERGEPSTLAVCSPYLVFAANVILLVVLVLIGSPEPGPSAAAITLMVVSAVLGITQLIIVVRESLIADVSGLLQYVSSGAFVLGVAPPLVWLPALFGAG